MVKIFRPIAVKDADGNVIGYTEKTYATYTYDAWGKLIGITNYAGESLLNRPNNTALANVNPLRYRGYYYDTETGFYYLQSRYYDPAVRRFLNADAYASTGQGFVGTNMFAYCCNNPVKYLDSSGLVCVPATPGDEANFEEFLEEYSNVTDGEVYEHPTDSATYTVKIETVNHKHRERLISNETSLGISCGEITVSAALKTTSAQFGGISAAVSQIFSIWTSLPVAALIFVVTAIDSESEDPLPDGTYTKYTVEYTYQETLKRSIHINRYVNITVNSQDTVVLYVSHKKDGSVKNSHLYKYQFKTEVS